MITFKEFCQRGGKATSPAKRLAYVTNGKLGGRPSKRINAEPLKPCCFCPREIQKDEKKGSMGRLHYHTACFVAEPAHNPTKIKILEG